MKKIIYIAGALMLLFPALAGAQALPYTAADYDAVSLGKAGANLTETNTIANSALNNAAAMPFSELPYEATFGYALWQPSSSYANVINAGFAYNLKQKFAIGFGFNMGLNKPYDIIDASGAANGTFTPKDIHAALGMAYRFLPYLSVGVNVGYANSTLSADHKYGALAADVFVMAKVKDFKATAGVSNLGSKVTSANGLKFSLPASFALGAGYEKTFAKKHGVDVSFDADYYFKGGLAASLGAEYTYDDLVSVRAGYHLGGKTVIPSYASLGAGVKFSGVRLDLAYLIASGPMKNTLAVSLGLSF